MMMDRWNVEFKIGGVLFYMEFSGTYLDVSDAADVIAKRLGVETTGSIDYIGILS